MAHIVEFSITGLAGKKGTITHKLDRNLNVFFGLNGTGKTSLLKILHSAMSGNPAMILDNVPFTEAEVKIFSVDYNETFTRRIRKKKASHIRSDEFPVDEISEETNVRWIMESGPGLVWKYEENEKLNKKSETSGWNHRYLPTSRLHVLSLGRQSQIKGIDVDNSITEERLDAYFASFVKQLWMKYSADVFKKVRSAQEIGLGNILQAILGPTVKTNTRRKKSRKHITPEEAYDCVTKFLNRQIKISPIYEFESFKHRYETEGFLQQIVYDIFTIESNIEAAMAPRKKLQNLIERLYSGGKKINFEENDISVLSKSGENIGLRSLSSGEKHLLRLLVETLMVDCNTIIIDEPELSLHIDWQLELIEIMQLLNPSAQFIIATHSPEIMAHVPDERIISL